MIGLREAPEAVVQGLQEIDPRARLINIGPDRWLLGVQNPNRVARKAAQERLARAELLPVASAEDRATHTALLKLCAAGLRPIELYEMREPDQRIVRDFRERDENWRIRAQDTFEERLEDTVEDANHLEQRKAKMRDYARSELPSIWKYVRRGVRSFTRRRRTPSSSARTIIRAFR